MSTSFLDAADRLGARLCRDSIWWGRRCNWIAGYKDNSPVVTHQALGPDLFRGTCGIALFLFHLWAATGEKIFRKTAEGALAHSLSRVGPGRVGFFTGLSGLCYGAARAAVVTRDEAYFNEALRIARIFAAQDVNADIISGSAGCIAPLISLYRQHRADFLLDLAIKHGRMLVDRAERQDAGWSWKTLPTAPRAMPCYGFGVAGIATALLELSHAIGEEQFRLAGIEGFRYIRSVYDSIEGNWPDYRVSGVRTPDGSIKPLFSFSWCHGAAGIGLAHLRAWQLLGESACREQANAAIRTTTQTIHQSLSQLNYSLSHGAMGIAELMLSAGSVLESPEHISSARQIGESGIQQYEDERVLWPCGGGGGFETPDLMLGLAGIAYFYLRLHDPKEVPSVLLPVPEDHGNSRSMDTTDGSLADADAWTEEDLTAVPLGVAGIKSGLGDLE
jgi:lantibiotic biosynthesis protein